MPPGKSRRLGGGSLDGALTTVADALFSCARALALAGRPRLLAVAYGNGRADADADADAAEVVDG